MGHSGSSTLLNRVKRHILPSSSKNIHWHIDYLLDNNSAIISKIWMIPAKQKLECIIAQELLNISDGHIPQFGSSDCKCLSHLIFLRNSSTLLDKIKKEYEK